MKCQRHDEGKRLDFLVLAQQCHYWRPLRRLVYQPTLQDAWYDARLSHCTGSTTLQTYCLLPFTVDQTVLVKHAFHSQS